MSDVIAEYRELETRILAAIREEWDEAECDTLWFDVFRFQRRWNQPYANFCATRAEPRTWQEIPAVPLAAFKYATLSVVPLELVTPLGCESSSPHAIDSTSPKHAPRINLIALSYWLSTQSYICRQPSSVGASVPVEFG